MYWFPVWVQEKNLTEIENVKKELLEESWHISNEIEYLWSTIASNYEDTILKYYIAKNCVFHKQNLEEWEYIEVLKVSLEEFEKMIIDWKINCPTTLSCFTLAKFKNLI